MLEKYSYLVILDHRSLFVLVYIFYVPYCIFNVSNRAKVTNTVISY